MPSLRGARVCAKTPGAATLNASVVLVPTAVDMNSRREIPRDLVIMCSLGMIQINNLGVNTQKLQQRFRRASSQPALRRDAEIVHDLFRCGHPLLRSGNTVRV